MKNDATTHGAFTFTLLWWVLASVIAQEETTPEVSGSESCEAQNPSPNSEQEQCGLYLAESTIKGAGLGIFSGKDVTKGEKVGRGDICIPFVEYYWNNGSPIQPNPFKDYFWAGHAMGMNSESYTDDIEALCLGLDCLVNCNLALVNVEKAVPVYDDASNHDMHRSRDPGVGAFTPYYNGSTKASRDIPAGGELFKFYGDSWFTTRERIFGKIPLRFDYPAAMILLERFSNVTNMTAASENQQFKPPVWLVDYYQLILGIGQQDEWESRLVNAWPSTLGDAHRALQAGDLGMLQQAAATRSLDWLNEHGRCVDNIQVGNSTLPQAGRGAFATRSISVGGIVATSPLHHVPDKSILNRHKFSKKVSQESDPEYLTMDRMPTTWIRHVDQIVGYQLALNYCYGHVLSSVLLCPYGPGISYLNHNQTRANVKIRWAERFPAGHDSSVLSDYSVNDLSSTEKSLLAFDFVATRDIQVGEEMFLDYGDMWEEAWQNHVKTYPTTTKDEGYSSALQWNKKFQGSWLRTFEEQRLDPYPDHLQLRCHTQLLFLPTARRNRRPLHRVVFEWADSDFGEPCLILDRFMEADSYWYTVQLEVWEDDSGEKEKGIANTAYEPRVTWVERTDVPRAAIRFFNVPGTTDLHLRDAFRHSIGIPDDMFPIQWRNNR